jgi:hypothetical protein
MRMGIGGGNFLSLTRYEASFQDLSLIPPFSVLDILSFSSPHPQPLRYKAASTARMLGLTFYTIAGSAACRK